MNFSRRSRQITRRSRIVLHQTVTATGTATAADEAMASEVTEAIVATVVIVIEARATDMEVEVVAMAAATVHRTALLTSLQPLLALQMRTPKPLTTTLNMPSGPLTMLATQPRTHTLPMAVLRQSWLNIRRATDSTTVKLTQLDRHNLLHLALVLQHHHLLLQSPQATELHHLPHHHLLDRQELAMVQYLLHQACKCIGASAISLKLRRHDLHVSLQPFYC